MTQVFFSHVEEDFGVVKTIAGAVEAAGYATWYYERDSVPGPSYLSQIVDAIDASQVALLVLSRDALGSLQVDKEVVRAHESGKAFVPVLVGLTHAEFKQRRPDWAMMTGAAVSLAVPPEGAAAVAERIVTGLRRLGFTPAPGAAEQRGDSAPALPPAPPPAAPPAAPAAEPPWLALGVAAALTRRYEADQRHFLGTLAALLEDALPGVVTVERRGGLFGPRGVKRVVLELDERRYGLEDAGRAALSATCAHVVRGIALKTETLSVEEWLAQVGAALDQRAHQSSAARDALARVIG